MHGFSHKNQYRRKTSIYLRLLTVCYWCLIIFLFHWPIFTLCGWSVSVRKTVHLRYQLRQQGGQDVSSIEYTHTNQKDVQTSSRVWLHTCVEAMFNIFNHESTNMEEHLTKFQHMVVVKLHAAACTAFESDLVARMLQTLPSDYDQFVQAIRPSVNEKTLRRLIGAIQCEALRMKSKTIKPKTEALNAAKR